MIRRSLWVLCELCVSVVSVSLPLHSPLRHKEHKGRRKLFRLVDRLLVALLALLLLPSICLSQTKRVVVVQADGLPYAVVDRFVHERDARTGKSELPWFDYIFYQRGARLANFYVRGMSLSAPSWSLIDTGQHLQIKGNVEFDRYTMQTYDYLNFIPFYIQATIGRRIRHITNKAATTPPTSPPNQLMPPRLRIRSRNGSSPRCSATHNSFAPSNPPKTPAMAASPPDAGRPLRASSRPNTQRPMSAPIATITPKLVTSKLPTRKNVGYIVKIMCEPRGPALRQRL